MARLTTSRTRINEFQSLQGRSPQQQPQQQVRAPGPQGPTQIQAPTSLPQSRMNPSGALRQTNVQDPTGAKWSQGGVPTTRFGAQAARQSTAMSGGGGWTGYRNQNFNANQQLPRPHASQLLEERMRNASLAAGAPQISDARIPGTFGPGFSQPPPMTPQQRAMQAEANRGDNRDQALYQAQQDRVAQAEANRGDPSARANIAPYTPSSNIVQQQQGLVVGSSGSGLAADPGDGSDVPDDTRGTGYSDAEIEHGGVSGIIDESDEFSVDGDGNIHDSHGNILGRVDDPSSWPESVRAAVREANGGEETTAERQHRESTQSAQLDQFGIDDPASRQILSAIDNDPKLHITDDGDIVDSDTGERYGSVYQPPDTWEGRARNISEGYMRRNQDRYGDGWVYGEGQGESREGILDQLTKLEKPEELNADELISAQNARRAGDMARNIRAAMEAGSRAGMGAEGMTGLTAGVQQSGQNAMAEASEQTRLQVEAQNLQRQMDFYKTKAQALLQQAAFEQDVKMKEMMIAAARQMEAQQYEHQKALIDLQNKVTWGDVLGGGLGLLGNIGGTAAGIGLGNWMGGGGKDNG